MDHNYSLIPKNFLWITTEGMDQFIVAGSINAALFFF